jgi:hypothetical protein
MASSDDFDIEGVFTLEVLASYPGIYSMFHHDIMNIEGMKTIDAVRWLAAKAPRQRSLEIQPSHLQYWEAFKVKFKIFLCTKNKKYQNLRKEITKGERTAQVALVSSISSVIGSYLGTAGAVVAPLVVLSLISVIKIGKEAYCRTIDIDSLIAVPKDNSQETFQ